MANEMAHYAADCWDAEILNSYGWIECVGCADRSAYDLTVHSVRTGRALVVREALETPVTYEKTVATLDKKTMGPKFKKAAKIVEDAVAGLNDTRLSSVERDLEQKGSSDIQGADGLSYTLTPDFISISRKTFKESSTWVTCHKSKGLKRSACRSRIYAQCHRALLRYWPNPLFRPRA